MGRLSVGKKLGIILGAVLVLLAGGGGALYATGMFDDAVEEAAGVPAEPIATYVEMKPLSAPVINKANKVLFNVLLVMSLEVSDSSVKDDIARMMPRLRDRMLRELYANGIMRHDGTGRFDLEGVKERMLNVAQGTVKADMIRDVLVVSAIRIN